MNNNPHRLFDPMSPLLHQTMVAMDCRCREKFFKTFPNGLREREFLEGGLAKFPNFHHVYARESRIRLIGNIDKFAIFVWRRASVHESLIILVISLRTADN